jgi:hypothetical protein
MAIDAILPGSNTTLSCDTLLPFYWVSFAGIPSLSQPLTPYVGLILSLIIILAAKYARSPWRKVPPGPKGLPILGNALQLDDKLWMFKKDCKESFRTSSFLCRRLPDSRCSRERL